MSAATDAQEALADAQEAAEGVATAGSATLAVSELAARLRRRGIRVERATLANWLLDWQRRGIAEEIEPGRWRLTAEGASVRRGSPSLRLEQLDEG